MDTHKNRWQIRRYQYHDAISARRNTSRLRIFFEFNWMEVDFSGFRRTLPDCFGGCQHETSRCSCAERQGQRQGTKTF